MQGKPRILTARKINKIDWVNNTTSIYDFCSFSEGNSLPGFFKKHLTYLCRYINKFDIIIGARLFINRKNFDIIISHNGKQAVTYSLLSFLLIKKKNLHFLNEIYLQKPIKIRQQIRPLIYKLLFRNIDYIRVSATSEIINYSEVLNINKNRFWFLPFPTPVQYPRIVKTEEDYILSAGKQYRDYATLIKAIKGTNFKLIIVSDRNSMKDLEICQEVTVFYDIRKEQYLDLLLKSKFVVVPLNNDFCSCGQIAILEAMSYGKPVIVTKVAGSIDYVVDDKTGLIYEKGNFLDLRMKIISLSENKELRNRIAQEALWTVKNIFNYDVFVTKYFQFINDKWQDMGNK